MSKKTLEVNTNSLEMILDIRKKNISRDIKKFNEKYLKHKLDKYGNDETYANPIAISNYFFKQINPERTVEPNYNCGQLEAIWRLYTEIIEQINMEVDVFPPTLSHFCKFAGMSLSKLQSLRTSRDTDMKSLVNAIYDEVYDSNLMLSQSFKSSTRATEYRMKYENEALEKKVPTINIDVKTKEIDLDKVKERLKEIQNISSKKIDYEGK